MKQRQGNILLVAVNSKYIHSNLAVYSLKKYAAQHSHPEIQIAEYTINQPREKILADICRKSPDVLLFSCYIWNILTVRELVSDFRKIRPEVKIWLGGPEVSHDAEEAILSMTGISGIICGEGERATLELCRHYQEGEPKLDEIFDLVYRREDHTICQTPVSRRMNLDDIDFVYGDMKPFDHRIIYYESSRGCPFSCSYCLSSVDKKLAFRSVEKVRKELQFFLDHKVPQVKFIDRTFNCRHDHAMEIWKYIQANDNGITNFHFEIAADAMDDEEMELLTSMRPGLVQLEIGVQSTNPQTIQEINRPMDFAKVSEVVTGILRRGNVHVHLDLIAGLPYEDAASFRKSFNDVFSLHPHQLQLGFLKVLKGSPIRANREKYGMEYSETPPYEVLRTNWISYDELSELKLVEEMLDTYYNSGQFMQSLEYLQQTSVFPDDFALFKELAAWYRSHEMDNINLSRNSRYENLLNFGLSHIAEDDKQTKFREAIAYDYYARDNVKNRPDFLGSDRVSKSFSREFYAKEAEEHNILSGEYFSHMDSRTLRNVTHLEVIGGEMMLFDYTDRDPITKNAKVIIIPELS